MSSVPSPKRLLSYSLPKVLGGLRRDLEHHLRARSRYSVSPPKYQAKSRSPPSPIDASGPSFGPAIKPSSDVACPYGLSPWPRPPTLFVRPTDLSLIASLPTHSVAGSDDAWWIASQGCSGNSPAPNVRRRSPPATLTALRRRVEIVHARHATLSRRLLVNRRYGVTTPAVLAAQRTLPATGRAQRALARLTLAGLAPRTPLESKNELGMPPSSKQIRAIVLSAVA